MTLTEILQQAKSLSPSDFDSLLNQLLSIRETISEQVEESAPQAHWGRSLNQLLDELEPIELEYPEIEDPVQWLKHLRAKFPR